MALKCVFRFEALDSTKSLNQRAELLFKKGIYFGGRVTTDTNNITNVITISPFRLISYDGMYVLSDSNINLTLEIGDFYIVCRAKYIIDDSPDVSVLAILKETFNDLPIEEKQNYVIFALVTSSASGITKINEKEYREEISQLGRNTNKGYFESEEDLLQVDALEGDFATVKSSNDTEVILYTYNGERWIAFLNSRGTETDLLSHKLNNDIDVVHGAGVLPSEITDQNGNKGALHVTINQLNSLEKLNKVTTQQVQVPITTIGKLQIIELDYGNNCISSYTITPSLIEVNSRNEVTLGKFYVDTLNGLLYIFGTNNTSVTFTYSYNYLKKEVITDNEVYKIPRQNELQALKGNEYSINFSEQYPSNSNKFITSKSPVPKRISANWDVKIYGNETYLVSPNRETIFVGTDSNEYIKFFEVLSLGDNSLPIALDSVHMARFENNTIVSVNSITDTNGWVEQNDTPSYYERVALKIKPYSEFVAQSISSIRCTVSYHKMEGLGEISTPNGIEYLANTIYKNNYREFNTVKVDCLFGFKINSGANEIAYFKPNEIGIKGNDGISDGYGIKISKNRISFQHTNNDIAYFEQEIGTKNKLKLSVTNSFILNTNNGDVEITASNGDVSIKPSTNSGALRLFNSGTYSQLQNGIYIGDGDREIIAKGSDVSLYNNSKAIIHVLKDTTQSTTKQEKISTKIDSVVSGTASYSSEIIQYADELSINTYTLGNKSSYFSIPNRITLKSEELSSGTSTNNYSAISIEKFSISLKIKENNSDTNTLVINNSSGNKGIELNTINGLELKNTRTIGGVLKENNIIIDSSALMMKAKSGNYYGQINVSSNELGFIIGLDDGVTYYSTASINSNSIELYHYNNSSDTGLQLLDNYSSLNYTYKNTVEQSGTTTINVKQSIISEDTSLLNIRLYDQTTTQTSNNSTTVVNSNAQVLLYKEFSGNNKGVLRLLAGTETDGISSIELYNSVASISNPTLVQIKSNITGNGNSITVSPITGIILNRNGTTISLVDNAIKATSSNFNISESNDSLNDSIYTTNIRSFKMIQNTPYSIGFLDSLLISPDAASIVLSDANSISSSSGTNFAEISIKQIVNSHREIVLRSLEQATGLVEYKLLIHSNNGIHLTTSSVPANSMTISLTSSLISISGCSHNSILVNNDTNGILMTSYYDSTNHTGTCLSFNSNYVGIENLSFSTSIVLNSTFGEHKISLNASGNILEFNNRNATIDPWHDNFVGTNDLTVNINGTIYQVVLRAVPTSTT